MSNILHTYVPKVKYSRIQGKPSVTVSAKGISNGLSDTYNDGADFGPDTLLNATSPNQYGSPYTQTSGIQEAIDYVWNNGGGRIYIKNGTYNLTGTILSGNNPGTLGTTYNASQNLPPLEIIGESMDGVILQGQTPGISIVQNTAGNYVNVQYLLLKNLTFKSTYPTPSSPERNINTMSFSYVGATNESIIIWKNVHVIGTQGTNGQIADFVNSSPNTVRIMDNIIWENIPGWNINYPNSGTISVYARNFKVIVGPGPGMTDNAIAFNNGNNQPYSCNILTDMDLIFDATNAASASGGSGWLAFGLGPNNSPTNIYGKIKIKAINTGNLAGSATGYQVIIGASNFANIDIDGIGNVGGINVSGSANGMGGSHNKYKIKINGTGDIDTYVDSGYGYNDYDIDVTLTSSVNGAMFTYNLTNGTASLYDRVKIKFNSPNGSTYSQSLLRTYYNPSSNVLIEKAYLPNWPSGNVALGYLTNGPLNRINWKNVFPYPNIFLNDMFGGSYYNGPFPNLSSSISANTVYQNYYFDDIYVIAQVTMNQTSTASASASIQTGSSSSSLTAYEQASEPAGTTAGQVKTIKAFVPLGWYYEIATSNATINAVYVKPAS